MIAVDHIPGPVDTFNSRRSRAYRVEVRITGGSGPSRGEAPGGSLRFDVSEDEGGGDGLNGGEALLLAVGGCYANDLHRLLKKHAIEVEGFTIIVRGEWGGDPVVCRRITCSLDLETDAPDDAVNGMRRELDANAAIPATLRAGVPVVLE